MTTEDKNESKNTIVEESKISENIVSEEKMPLNNQHFIKRYLYGNRRIK